jgi:uncharacterized protein (TIRG00374 family)
MRQTLKIGLSIALVVAIFFFALPKIADLSQVWTEIGEMTWLEIGTLVAAALWNIFTYWFVMMAALPGSNLWQTMKINQASTAVANTLPGGGALGVGLTYSMYSAYGFTKSQISLSVLVSGIWNNFVKLGMPVVALAIVAVQGDASNGLLVAAFAGVLVLLAALGAFAAVLSSDRLALAVGRRLAAVVGSVRRLLRKEPGGDVAEGTVRFRHDAVGLVERRWVRLTVATVVSHISLFLVLLIALRHVGVSDQEVSWAQVLAAFSFVRLISALPVTPGGLGVVELGLTAALVAAGGDEEQVVAAVLVYRALTYLLPIPLGLFLYVRWRGGRARRERVEAAAT